MTSVGHRVRALVTDLALFEKDDAGLLALTAVAPGPGTVSERAGAVRDRCPWELSVAPSVAELEAPDPSLVERLRRWDPEGRFLRPGA